MGCLSGNCGGTACKPQLLTPWIAPRINGWRLVGLPPGVPERVVKLAGDREWNGTEAEGVYNQVKEFLRLQGVSISATELCGWANEQWCASDPERCKSVNNEEARLASGQKAALVAEPMDWAPAFWKVWNVALTGYPSDDPIQPGFIDSFIGIALAMTLGPLGCLKCNKHFRSLLEEYPPERINCYRQARVWLWRVHNETREGLSPTPYYSIAKIHGWDLLEEEEVLRIIKEELRAN